MTLLTRPRAAHAVPLLMPTVVVESEPLTGAINEPPTGRLYNLTGIPVNDRFGSCQEPRLVPLWASACLPWGIADIAELSPATACCR